MLLEKPITFVILVNWLWTSFGPAYHKGPKNSPAFHRLSLNHSNTFPWIARGKKKAIFSCIEKSVSSLGGFFVKDRFL